MPSSGPHMEPLRRLYERALAYVADRRPGDDPRARTSTFWRDIFNNRPGLPGLNDLSAFRRGAHVYGTGGLAEVDPVTEGRLHAESSLLAARLVTPEFVAALNEPAFGAPLVYDFQGVACSENFLMNARKTRLYLRAVERHRPDLLRPGGGPRVCDIGAGWGAVGYQLHQVLDPARFTDVDLPGNLLPASVFLGATLGREAAFGPGGAASLRFVLPEHAEALDEPYDLVLNSLSMQEMDLETVAGYVDWISRRLVPGGLFISINRHGLAGVRRASEFGFQRFELLELESLDSWLSDMGQAYLMVLRVPEHGASAAAPRFDPVALDTLAELMQLNLGEELRPLCAALAAGNLSDDDRGWLAAVQRWLDEPVKAAKVVLADALPEREGPLAPVVPYLRGLTLLVAHRHAEALEALDAACAAGLTGCARAKALAVGCALRRALGQALDEHFLARQDDMAAAAPFWARQLRERIDGPLGAFKAEVVGKIHARPDAEAA